LLVRDVAAEFGGKVRVAVEDYGNSEMARRFGVRRYPVVFVDDVLLARPKDFGFGGSADTSGGLYVPWLDPANQQRFKEDLRRAVSRRLAGERVTGLDIADVTAGDADPADGPARLPDLRLTDINGAAVDPASLAGRTVIVEMWATWCPPCRSTLAWLDGYQRQHRDTVTVLALAVDSELPEVRKLMATLQPSYRVVFATPEVVKAYGAAAAVPKLTIFAPSGTRAQVLYGAPPDLHQQVEAAVARVAGQR
jgi:thiol-disulfide isomerase/thioredoxin